MQVISSPVIKNSGKVPAGRIRITGARIFAGLTCRKTLCAKRSRGIFSAPSPRARVLFTSNSSRISERRLFNDAVFHGPMHLLISLSAVHYLLSLFFPFPLSLSTSLPPYSPFSHYMRRVILISRCIYIHKNTRLIRAAIITRGNLFFVFAGACRKLSGIKPEIDL